MAYLLIWFRRRRHSRTEISNDANPMSLRQKSSPPLLLYVWTRAVTMRRMAYEVRSRGLLIVVAIVVAAVA